MAVPTYAAAGAGANAAAASGTIDVPWCAASAGRSAWIQLVIKDAGTDTVTTPSGWTLVRSGNIDSPTKSGMQYIFKKTTPMSGSETGNVTITITGGNDRKIARMYGFDGSNNTDEGGAAVADNNTSVPAGSVTTSGANRLALHFLALFAATTVGNFTGETGGDWTEAVAEHSNVATLQLQTANMASAGTISGGTVTPGAGGAYSTITAALQEASAATGNASRDMAVVGAG